LAPQLAEVTNQIPNAEKELNIEILTDMNNLHRAKYLYEWAEEACKRLRDRNHPLPKLGIAKALGIIRNPSYLGKIRVVLGRSKARYRVIARFAREGMLYAIWSLNWDCILEVGLESVGFEQYDLGMRSNQPWQTTYVTYITTHDHARPAAIDNNLTIYKPHGCVRALIRAEQEFDNENHSLAQELAEGFLITSSDLNELEKKFTDENQQSFCYNLHTQLAGHPLIAIGWSASEKYLQSLAEKALQPHKEQGEADELAIVDLEFNNKGHKKLTECYHSDRSKAFVQVKKENHGKLTTDRLLLWIQTLYALDCLKEHAEDVNKHAIQDMHNRLSENPSTGDFLIDWVDNFLPTWVRLCWREGLVEYFQGGVLIPNSSIRLEKRDEHVPWKIEGIKRPDLQSASYVLIQIGNNSENWDFKSYPGGFWNESRGQLAIPIPAWGKRRVDLLGLKPLIDSILEEKGMSYIRDVAVIPVPTQIDEEIEDEKIIPLKRSLASRMSVLPFAEPDKIQIHSLNNL